MTGVAPGATRLSSLVAAVLGFACAPQGATPWVHPTAAEWQAARDTLAHLGRAGPRAPFAASVRTWVREPRSGRIVDGRGALAVDPGRAARMIWSARRVPRRSTCG